MDGWIDNTVRLVPYADLQVETTPALDGFEPEDTSAASASQETQSDLMAGALTFEDLDRALFDGSRPPVISVSREDSLAKAQSLMMRYDYSQLPVMSGEHTCRGAVSWESIARILAHKSDAKLVDCIVPVDQLSISDDVLSNIPKITANGFVVTKAGQGRVCGVVTTADVSAAFEELAGPFLLIGIAEHLLRTVVASCFDAETILELASVKHAKRPVEGLTMGELKALFDAEKNWDTLQWPVDRAVFRGLLEDVLVLRNQVMHFRGAHSESTELTAVRNLIAWLRYLID